MYVDLRRLTLRRSVSGTSRSQTPPRSSSSYPNESSTPPQKSRGFLSTPPRRTYHRFFSESSSTWGSHAEVHVDDEDAVTLGEDEDEFGLPSLAGSYGLKKKNSAPATAPLAKSISNPSNRSASGGPGSSLWRADSGDISEERGLPNYPTTKPTEGKILRPQYRDILRGIASTKFHSKLNLSSFSDRSSQFSTSYTSSSSSCGRYTERGRSSLGSNNTNKQVQEITTVKFDISV